MVKTTTNATRRVNRQAAKPTRRAPIQPEMPPWMFPDCQMVDDNGNPIPYPFPVFNLGDHPVPR